MGKGWPNGRGVIGTFPEDADALGLTERITDPVPFAEPYPDRASFRKADGTVDYEAYDRAGLDWRAAKAAHGVPRLTIPEYGTAAPFQVENYGTPGAPEWVVIHTHTVDAHFPRGYPMGYDGTPNGPKRYPSLRDALVAAIQRNVGEGIFVALAYAP